MRYGEELHKAAEEYVTGTPLPAQFEFLKPTLDALLEKKGTKHAEVKMALTRSLEPCDWRAPDVWVKGIADLLVLDEEESLAWVVDYKTGSNKYPDKGQLDLMSLMVFALYPNIEKVNSALLFVVKNSVVKHKLERSQTEALWWQYRERTGRIESSISTGVWNPKSSGLCPWCPVKSCEYNPKH